MTTPANSKQVPDHAILDHFNKQTYLANSYVYSLGNTEITTTGETPLLYISNPSISATAFPSNYKSIFIGLKRFTCLTASETAILRVYLNPTVVSGGTSEVPVNLRPASSNTSIASLLLEPSVSTNGTLIEVLSVGAFVTYLTNTLCIIDPGQSVLITIQTGSATTNIGASIGWYEL